MCSNRFGGSLVLNGLRLTSLRTVCAYTTDVGAAADPTARPSAALDAVFMNSRRFRYRRSSVMSDDRIADAFRMSTPAPFHRPACDADDSGVSVAIEPPAAPFTAF